MRSATERIRTLRQLAPRERYILLNAWCLLVVVDLALRMLPVTWLMPRRATLGARSLSLPVDRIAWLVRVAGRHVPVRGTCLTESLVLARLLRREGVDAVVRIGVSRHTGGLRAHAWLEHQGHVVFGSPDSETYTALLPAADLSRRA